MSPSRFDRLLTNSDGLDEDRLMQLVLECSRAEMSPRGLALRVHVGWQWSDDPPPGLCGAFELLCENPGLHSLRLGELDGMPSITDEDPRLDRQAGEKVEVYVHTKMADADALASAARLALVDESASSSIHGGIGLSVRGSVSALTLGYGLLCTTTPQALRFLVPALDAERIDHVLLPVAKGLAAPTRLRLLTWGDLWVAAERFTSRDLDDAELA